MTRLLTRAISKGRRTLANNLVRREVQIQPDVPLISFSFDDAPCSAFDLGAEILQLHGARATYFMSMGLIDTSTEVGVIAGQDRLERALHQGQELGCHTFDHLDAWHTSHKDFLASVQANQDALQARWPDQVFSVFAYPKSGARVGVKAALQQRFACCRGGGQDINTGVADLNLLKACFLDHRAKVDIHFVRTLIDRNARERGWLIFAAHDISDAGTAFGCSTNFFAEVVRYAAASGARLLPVGQACALINASD